MQLAVDQRLIARAWQHYKSCRLCEHDCQVNRENGEKGFCKADSEARVYRQRLEFGEELELIPSQLFYLSGCDLRCKFCIAERRAFDPSIGVPLTSSYLSEAVEWGRQQGAKNIQWVGGEPTIHIPAIIDAMSRCDDLPPVVWKSDFHATRAAFDLLDGLVDVYVADLKFGNDKCAENIAGVANYLWIVTRNLHIATQQADLIVRHLLLPGHWECCFIPIVRWMHDNLPEVKFSIRDGYLPRWQAPRDTQLRRYLPTGIGEQAREVARSAGLRVIV